MILGEFLDLHKAQSIMCKMKRKINTFKAIVRKDQAKHLALRKHSNLVPFPSSNPVFPKFSFCPTKSYNYEKLPVTFSFHLYCPPCLRKKLPT